MRAHELQARASTDDDGRSHEDLGQQLNIAFWLLTSLATLFLALRIYCKFERVRSLWWDDYLLIAAWVRNSSVQCSRRNTKLTHSNHRPPSWSQPVPHRRALPLTMARTGTT